MENPNVWQKLADHIRAFFWSGRPVIISYIDRDDYFRDPTKFGGGDGMTCDGNCTVRRGVSTVRIFLPVLPEADRLDTLRHECGHIRYHFVERLTPEAGAEARDLFRELDPTDAALYDARPDGKDVTGEAVVRIADRLRAGLPVPDMSPSLDLMVRRVMAPAPASALAFVGVAVLALAAFLSLLPAPVAAETYYYPTPTGSAVHVYEYDGECLRVAPRTATGPSALPIPQGGMAALLDSLPRHPDFRVTNVRCSDYRDSPGWDGIVRSGWCSTLDEQTPAPEFQNIGLIYYPCE